MLYNKILIAVDSSEYSMKAAKKGLELANQLKADAALLFVIDLTKATGNVDAGILPAEAIIVLKKEAEQTLDQLATMYSEKEPVKFIIEGHPYEDILKTAKIWQADLIVVGTHGRTGLLSLLMGSVTEHLLEHSKIPVMVVPAK